jgi:hypothetical protein
MNPDPCRVNFKTFKVLQKPQSGEKGIFKWLLVTLINIYFKQKKMGPGFGPHFFMISGC